MGDLSAYQRLLHMNALVEVIESIYVARQFHCQNGRDCNWNSKLWNVKVNFMQQPRTIIRPTSLDSIQGHSKFRSQAKSDEKLHASSSKHLRV